jgi:hypothetical protein
MIFVYFFLSALHYPDFSVVPTVLGSMLVCLLCTSPLLVSGIVLLFLKRPVSLILQLLSTILYGIAVFYAFCETWGEYNCMAGIQFFGLGFGSFVYMIPAWIVMLVLNRYDTRKEIPPVENETNSP